MNPRDRFSENNHEEHEEHEEEREIEGVREIALSFRRCLFHFLSFSLPFFVLFVFFVVKNI